MGRRVCCDLQKNTAPLHTSCCTPSAPLRLWQQLPPSSSALLSLGIILTMHNKHTNWGPLVWLGRRSSTLARPSLRTRRRWRPHRAHLWTGRDWYCFERKQVRWRGEKKRDFFLQHHTLKVGVIAVISSKKWFKNPSCGCATCLKTTAQSHIQHYS